MSQLNPLQNWTTEESLYLFRTLTELQSHYNSLIATNYNESLKLVDMLNAVRAKWLDDSAKNIQLTTKAERLNRQNNEILNNIQSLNNSLQHAETQIATFSSENKRLESELSEYKKRFEQLQHMLQDDQKNDPAIIKLTRLNFFGTAKRVEDADESSSYEAMEEGEIVVGRTLKAVENTATKGSRSRTRREYGQISTQHTGDECNRLYDSHQTPNKRAREQFLERHIEEEEEKAPNESSTPPKQSRVANKISALVDLELDVEGKEPTKAKVTIRRSMNRSMSESNLLNEKAKAAQKTPMAQGLSTFDLRSPMPGFGNSWTNGQAIESRQHKFKPFRPLIDTCDVCNKYLTYAKNNALRCTDCNLRFHADCLRPAPMPCLPRVDTPKTPKKQRPRLQDFCPNQHPMIPPILINLVIALERDRLNFEGIYRIPGSQIRVEKLLVELKTAKILPQLSDYDTETITGCIKRFLKDLREPLIPTTSWAEFVQAAESENDDQLNYSILELPSPNRDTLAYMLIHWQRIAENANRNRMPIENLAVCLGPTVVGFSKDSNLCTDGASRETKKQVQVMTRLLRMPQDYWKRFIEYDIIGNTNTPNRKPITSQNTYSHLRSGRVVQKIDFMADQSILGPVTRTPPSSGLIQSVPRRPATGKYFEKPY